MSEYNGWTNYETWCTHLWITNDEAWYGYAREAASISPDALEEQTAEMIGLDDQKDLARDLLMTSLGEVNWREIAEALMEGEE